MAGFEIPTVAMRPPRFKKDKSVTVSFDTGEMNTEQKTALLDTDGQLGTLMFIPEELQAPIQKLDSEYEGKSPSKRLWSVLYVLWKQQGEKGDFDTFYTNTMEKIIDAYKDKLDQY